MKDSPLMGYTEQECYEIALKLRKQLGSTLYKRMTARKAVTKVHLHFESEVLKVVRYYHHTFIVEPYGQTARIHLRSEVCQIQPNSQMKAVSQT
jgi:hypothetical protein